MNSDPDTLAQLASFLREYRGAVASGNRQFLGQHTTFPLPFAESVYDMEAKARHRELASVDELLNERELLLWPEALDPRDAAHLVQLRRGAEKCDDPESPAIPDWTRGEPAVELCDGEATLTYLADPCEPETHTVTLRFARQGQAWRLRERSIRMGRGAH